MGLLSAFGSFGEPVSWSGQPQQQRRLRGPALPMPEPLAPTQVSPLQAMTPQALAASPPEVKSMPWDVRLQETMGSPLFQQGMALLAAGQPGGGGWGEAQDRFQQIDTRQQQQQLLQRQHRREDEGDQRQRTQWQRQDQQHASFQEAVANADPQTRQQLLAMGPDGYAQYIAQQMGSETERAWRSQESALDRQFQEREGALNRRSQEESTGLGRYFQRYDAERVATENETAARIQSVGLPALQNILTTIEEAGALRLPGQPIAARSRVTLGRLFGSGAEGRAALEVWRAQVLQPALEVMRGLGQMTEREFEAALSAFANPDMTYEAATRLINQRIQEANRRIATASITTQYFRENQGLTGVVNQRGEDYSQFLARELRDRNLMPSGDWASNNPFNRQNQSTSAAASPAPPGGPPPAAQQQGFTYWDGRMWTRPPRGEQRQQQRPQDRNNPYGAY